MAQRLVVVGAGAIGGTISAYLERSGIATHLVDVNEEHVHAIRAQGLIIDAYNESFRVHVPVDTPSAFDGGLEAVFLATKAPHTEAAMEWIAPRLRPDGWVLSAQNGLNELAIARHVGRNRTVGCFVNFSSDVMKPGVIHYGGPGTFAIGELDGPVTERVRRIGEWIQPFINPVLTDNIWGYLWSKLSYGAVLFATATTDETMADCVDHPRYRAVLRAIGAEVVGLARLQGIELLPFDGWDPNALDDRQESDAMFDRLSQVMRRNLKVRTGVWRDLAVHHRRTEVDSQYGPVLDLAAEHEYPVPKLTKLVEIIHGLEQGQLERGLSNLETLFTA